MDVEKWRKKGLGARRGKGIFPPTHTMNIIMI